MNKTEINLTPSAINKFVKSLLEKNQYLANIKIEGEVSNFKSSSGNFYFSIKDEESQVNCVVFKNNTYNLDFIPKNGMEVVVSGSILHNVKTGYYNFNVINIKESGVGILQKRYEALRLKLEQMGLFDEDKKQPIKKYYQRIALVTAPTSAAIKDMLTTIKRRNPLADVVIIPCIVQGEKAKASIVRAIKQVNEQNLADVMIVGRGGGSIEDLWAFNEEEVAITTYESKIPIISSVGHETDFTIIDYVADRRAPTPTAAAEFVTPDIYMWEENMNKSINQMAANLMQKVQYQRLALNKLIDNQYFVNPLINHINNLDYLTTNLKMIGKNQYNLVSYQLDKISQMKTLLIDKMTAKLKHNIASVERLHDNLDNLNPLAVLSRGYSVVKTKENKIVNSINNVHINDKIYIQVNDGKIETEVVNKYEE